MPLAKGPVELPVDDRRFGELFIAGIPFRSKPVRHAVHEEFPYLRDAIGVPPERLAIQLASSHLGSRFHLTGMIMIHHRARERCCVAGPVHKIICPDNKLELNFP